MNDERMGNKKILPLLIEFRATVLSMFKSLFD